LHGLRISSWTVMLFTVLVTWTPVYLFILKRGRVIYDDYRSSHPTANRVEKYEGVLKESIGRTLPDAFAGLKYVSVVGTLSILVFESSSYGLSRYDETWGAMIGYGLSYMKFMEFDLWWILPLIGIVVMISGFYLVLQTVQDILEKRYRMVHRAQQVSPSVPE